MWAAWLVDDLGLSGWNSFSSSVSLQNIIMIEGRNKIVGGIRNSIMDKWIVNTSIIKEREQRRALF